MKQKGSNPSEYFEREKYYTKGGGIDFPIIMSYKDTENPAFEPYFYFLNGHNDVVYFADANFTEELSESYEYNPWGLPLTQANKNNLLYTAREFDFDTGLQFYSSTYYKPSLAYSIFKNTNNNISLFNLIVLYLKQQTIYLYKNKNTLNYFLLPPGWGARPGCWVVISCPGGGVIGLACRPGRDCFCECLWDLNASCIYTFQACPFFALWTIKCCI